MKKLTTWLKWLDANILKVLVVGFIFVIPLYPKLPLEMVDYTYVAIRLEDLYVALVGVVFVIQFLRRKVTIPWKFASLFVIYWLAIFTSYLYGFYIQHTIAVNNLGLLHSLRRVEYMFIFFVVFTTIKSKKDFMFYLNLMFSVLAITCVYGIGQKFLGWPAVQTMNPEFAKGYILVLDSWARISSTFAGHYDFAAYLILLMPIIISFYISTNKKIYLALFLLALATLILTASRASYLSYLGAIILFLLFIRKFKLLVIILVATAILTPLSDNLTNRLTRTFQQTKMYVDPQTGQVIIPNESRPDDLPPGTFGTTVDTSKLGSQAKTVVDKQSQDRAKSQIRSEIVKEAHDTGKTLSEAQIAAMVEKTFGKQIPITKYLLDISLSTRFQVAWPRAINAFKKNPLLGLGPSALGEATDGDYFRWIGESGLLGTFFLLAIFFEIIRSIVVKLKKMDLENKYLYYGFLFGFLSLFVNASYIDVFEASKDAYTFWLITGIYIASLAYTTKSVATEKLAKK